MLIAAAALLTAGWLDRWDVGPLPLISVPASPLGIVLAGWAMFRYPHLPSEVRRDRRFFIIIFAWFAIGELTFIVVSRPTWNGFPAAAWWLTMDPNHPLFTAVSRIVPLGGIAFAVVYMGLWLRRWRNSHGIARRLATPIAIASSVVCVATIVELIVTIISASSRELDNIYTIEAYLQLGVPVAFVISVMRRRFARTRIVGLLLRLQGPARLPSVTSALRSVFEDPHLEIINRTAAPQPAAGMASQAAQLPDGSGNRLHLPIRSSSGEQLAVVLADPSLSPNDDFVQAALTASSFALENAQLEQALRAQLQELRESRLRIIQAGVVERRRLERDLHDGAQQQLLGLKIMLATAEADIDDSATRRGEPDQGRTRQCSRRTQRPRARDTSGRSQPGRAGAGRAIPGGSLYHASPGGPPRRPSSRIRRANGVFRDRRIHHQRDKARGCPRDHGYRHAGRRLAADRDRRRRERRRMRKRRNWNPRTHRPGARCERRLGP